MAEIYERLGNRDRAASILDTAISTALGRGEVWWLPALYVRKGEFESPAQRQVSVQRALELARSQHNRGLEQRILPLLAAGSR
ncbi:MAG: hypothetical protein ACM36C_05905 [Acidobacteriota bacterium]